MDEIKLMDDKKLDKAYTGLFDLLEMLHDNGVIKQDQYDDLRRFLNDI